MQVRDHALGIKDDIPKGDVNKEYMIQNAEKEVWVGVVCVLGVGVVLLGVGVAFYLSCNGGELV